jgi:hypothetical protein
VYCHRATSTNRGSTSSSEKSVESVIRNSSRFVEDDLRCFVRLDQCWPKESNYRESLRSSASSLPSSYTPLLFLNLLSYSALFATLATATPAASHPATATTHACRVSSCHASSHLPCLVLSPRPAFLPSQSYPTRLALLRSYRTGTGSVDVVAG